MSFDLYFYKHKDNSVSENDVAAYLTEHIISDYDSNQWVYENPDTGTYFTIERDTEIQDDEPDNFEDLVIINFYFSINFYRPTFFGLEAFPIVDSLVKHFDLYVLNPQDNQFPEYPQKFADGVLLESWIASNNSVSKRTHEGFTLEFMPREKSDYLWWYQLHRSELQASLKEDVYVPNLFVVKNNDNNLLYTACAWTTHIPIILPVVDYVFIQKKYKKLFRTVEESGIVPYNLIIENLGKYFSDFEFHVPDLMILYQTQADQMSKEFNNLKIYKSINEFGTGVAKDGFVNVPQ